MRPLVKICGIRRLEDAMLAAELGASALGFIFWPASPRFIDPYRAKRIVSALPPFIATVGVFVNEPEERASSIARLLNLSALQLHGDEDPAGLLRTGYRVIKAVPVTSELRPDAVQRLPSALTVLLDAHDPARRGGTGQTVDWALAAEIAATRRTMLSGGLNASNVQAAAAQVRPYAIDVSSGVESAPGVKDPEKLTALFAALGRCN